ncbi:MAG: hypothetical protein KAR06_04400 [Deltaproteobacteria bacterium]|nr:hypothetical protein [Deltaproteobacteria bacterium]
MAGPYGALLSGGLSALGGAGAFGSSDSGMSDMADAIMAGIKFSKEIYGEARTDLEQHRGAGTEALPWMKEVASAESPLYKMRMEDSEAAINRAMAARGLFGSGAATGELAESARRVTAEEAEARWERNKYLSDVGLRGSEATVQAGTATMGNISQMYSQLGAGYQQAGDTKAGIIGSTAGALNQAVQGGIGNAYFKKFMGGGGGGGGGRTYGGSSGTI